jgi:predicted nucleic acid-binding protein
VVTLDTNVAIYAFSQDEKAEAAREILAGADFVSVQLLNEYANVAMRKRRLTWPELEADIAVIRGTVPSIRAISHNAHHEALRVAKRYQISFFDALMIAVALSGGARTLYSEDMQHGLVIDDTLRIVDPFR